MLGLVPKEKLPTYDVLVRRGHRRSRSHDGPQLDAWVERFVRLFTQSIYKWVQTPLAVHVGHLDLDRERALQLPVVQKREW